MLRPGKWTFLQRIYAFNSCMKKSDIPQQPHEMYEGETKAVYAVNEKGKLEMAQTSGWDVETSVLQDAITEINRLSNEALKRVRNHESSPLEYHMYAQRMDIAMLAQAIGRFQWQIKRDFNPTRFSKLNNNKLDLYARVLGISIETLETIPDE